MKRDEGGFNEVAHSVTTEGAHMGPHGRLPFVAVRHGKVSRHDDVEPCPRVPGKGSTDSGARGG